MTVLVNFTINFSEPKKKLFYYQVYRVFLEIKVVRNFIFNKFGINNELDRRHPSPCRGLQSWKKFRSLGNKKYSLFDFKVFVRNKSCCKWYYNQICLQRKFSYVTFSSVQDHFKLLTAKRLLF